MTPSTILLVPVRAESSHDPNVSFGGRRKQACWHFLSFSHTPTLRTIITPNGWDRANKHNNKNKAAHTAASGKTLTIASP